MRSRQARVRCSAVSLPAAISAAAATALSSFGLDIYPLSVVLHPHAGVVAEASLGVVAEADLQDVTVAVVVVA